MASSRNTRASISPPQQRDARRSTGTPPRTHLSTKPTTSNRRSPPPSPQDLHKARETLTRRLTAHKAALKHRETEYLNLRGEYLSSGVEEEHLRAVEQGIASASDSLVPLKAAWMSVTAAREALSKTQDQVAAVEERIEHSAHSSWELYSMIAELRREVQVLKNELAAAKEERKVGGEETEVHTTSAQSTEPVLDSPRPSANTHPNSWASLDAMGLLNDWSSWILGYYSKKTMQYCGLVMWRQDASEDSDERQDEIMHDACKRAYGPEAQAATVEHYTSGLVEGLPFKNDTQLSILFPGNAAQGEFDPRLVSGHCRRGVGAQGYLDGTMSSCTLWKGQRLCIAVRPIDDSVPGA